MVVKHCPNCKRTLAVACKTCPACGYIFQAKKPVSTKSTDKKPVVIGQRLRPERCRKESQQGDECEYSKETEYEANVQRKAGVGDEKKDDTWPQNDDSFDALQQYTIKKQVIAENLNATPTVKKRGRPKGSKDKQKRLPKGYKQLKLVKNMESHSDADWASKERNTLVQTDGNANLDDSKLIRKRGRPRGSKNKQSLPSLFYAEDFDEFDSDDREECCSQVEDAFYIPADKKEKFSLILEDINQRIVGQTFKV